MLRSWRSTPASGGAADDFVGGDLGRGGGGVTVAGVPSGGVERTRLVTYATDTARQPFVRDREEQARRADAATRPFAQTGLLPVRTSSSPIARMTIPALSNSLPNVSSEKMPILSLWSSREARLPRY